MALAKNADSYDLDPMRDMKTAQEKFGASLTKQVMDFLALRSASGMRFEEYLYFALFNQPRSAYGAYMGDDRARAAFYIANDLVDWNSAEDKVNFAGALASAGLPTPAILAVAHPDRDAVGAEALRSTEAIRDYIQSLKGPVFGKPVIASHGDGSINIQSCSGDLATTDTGDAVSVDDIVDDIRPYFEKEGYLFQEVLRPHAGIAAMTGGRIATARMFALLDDGAATVRDVVLRLPAGENRVDNFRRAGNLAAPVNVENGVIGNACRGVGVAIESLAQHPDTNAPIEGAVLPEFAEAKALVEKAVSVFPKQHIQSWDVALTDAGPVLLEVNPGGNFNILQLATGRGAYDPEFRAFLERRLAARPDADANPKALKEAKKLLKLK